MAVGPGDLDGDGEFDYVVRCGSESHDPWYTAWKPSKKPYFLEAFHRDGRRLWTRSLSWNIESGVWFAPFVVFDVNGDGKAEVICKGNLPEDGDLRENEGVNKGKVLTGPDRILVLDGMTGKILAHAPWPERDYFMTRVHGHNYASRNQLAIACLDGKTPCILALRGTYGYMLVDAWQMKNGKLEALWQYRSGDFGRPWAGQGAHTTRVADLDGDGRDEIILGGAVLDDDGRPLWTTGHGHPDYLYVADITKKNPGLEVVTMYEYACKTGGFTCADAKTGKVVWELREPTHHIHEGYAGDIDARYRGWEIGGNDFISGGHTGKKVARHYSPDGELLFVGGQAPYADYKGGFIPHFAYWDADLQREEIAPRMLDYRGGECGGGISGFFLGQFDAEGDWREELVTSRTGEFRIFYTTIPAMDRRKCLMTDPIYRMSVVANASGYQEDPSMGILPTDDAVNLNLTMFKDIPNTLEGVVSAPLKQPVRGRLRLSGSDGVTVSPAEWEIDLAPGAITRKTASVLKSGDDIGWVYAELIRETGNPLCGRVQVGKVKPVQVAAPEGISVEAENYSSQMNGSVRKRNDKHGVHGQCISHWDAAGHRLGWEVKIPKTGYYRLVLRYAAASAAKRKLVLAGRDSGIFELSGTGGGGGLASEWCETALSKAGHPAVFHLTSGTLVFSLENVDGVYVNLDYLRFIPVP